MSHNHKSEREKISKLVSKLRKIHSLALCSYIKDSENAKRIYNKLLADCKEQYGLNFYAEVVRNLSEPFLLKGETPNKKKVVSTKAIENQNLMAEIFNSYINLFNPYNWLNITNNPKGKVDKRV
jgi:hypothetical protein